MEVPTPEQYAKLLAAKRTLMAEQGAGFMLSGDGDDGLTVKLPQLILDFNKRHPDAQIAMPYAALYEYSLKTGEQFQA